VNYCLLSQALNPTCCWLCAVDASAKRTVTKAVIMPNGYIFIIDTHKEESGYNYFTSSTADLTCTVILRKACVLRCVNEQAIA
jgi:hypothetical protein